ncbi:MAG: hypothetical protein H7329_00980 [Opitutaceae bacterium]|nr:hypothetical protein [Cytophagales bacterium]
MNKSVKTLLHFFQNRNFFLFLILFICLANCNSFSQAPKKKRTGPTANTESNTTISQSGDNKKFNSNKNSTTSNPAFRSNKNAVKKKQEQNSRFSGNDVVKKADKLNSPPPGQKTKVKVSAPVDQSSYGTQRNQSFKALEKPHEGMHDHQGDIVIKKNSHLDGSKQAAAVDHKGRTSETVDHSKYKNYRKKAFDKRESDFEHLNSQGSAQYGLRPEEGIDLEKRKSLRESNDRERMEYSGDFLPKAFKPTGSTYSGDIDVSGKEKKIKEGEKQRASYSGDLDLEAKKSNARKSDKERAEYSGDINLEERDKLRRGKQKEVAENTGDIAMHDVMKKAKEIRKKEKTISNYSGDILVRTIRHRDNKNRIKAKKIANWEGDIVIAKRRKGSHPSAAYSGGKVANSYKAREKYRRKMLKKYGRNPGIETPNYQRRKYEKPTYDKNESKIWDVQKYKETKTKETP